MAHKAADYGAWMVAVALVVVVALVGLWRFSIRPGSKQTLPGEAWQRIKEEYPLPAKQASDIALPTETFTAVLEANPFSPQRRQVPEQAQQAAGGDSHGQPAEPPAPKFIYKGRMQLGSRQRAILEDSAIQKTYFLEVGQAVANFKVLDIDEKRVLLSETQTHEEVAVPLASTASP